MIKLTILVYSSMSFDTYLKLCHISQNQDKKNSHHQKKPPKAHLYPPHTITDND